MIKSKTVVMREQISEAMARRDVEGAIALCRRALHYIDAREFQSWYAVNISLALCLLERDPKGSEDVEEAKEIYLNILDNLPENDWQKRSSILRNLGHLFEEKIRGNRGDNIEKAIHYYECAASDRLKVERTQDWALLKAAIGLARTSIVDGNEDKAKAAAADLSVALAHLDESKYSEERQEVAEALKKLGLGNQV